MVLPLSLLIGIRFSYSYHRNGMMSFVSIISIVAITLGITAMIVSLSAINGFERELNNRILAVIPHGEIESVNQPWDNWNDSLVKIKKLPGILVAAPYINFTGLIENGSNSQVLQIRGVHPNQEAYLNTSLKFVKNNTWPILLPGKQQIIIGKGIADILKIKSGDWVSVMIPDTYTSYYKPQQFRRIQLHVVGILQLNSQLDHSFAIIPLNDAQQYLNMNDSITGIAIKVRDIFNVNKLVHDAGKITKNYVFVKSWMNTHEYIYRDIQMIRSIIYIVMTLVISVACFNIVSTLMVVVKNKIRDIAVLRTLGVKNNFICAIFFWHSLLVGLSGSSCGTMIGTMISLQLTSIINGIEKLTNHQFLSSNIYFIDFIPSELHWKDIVYVLAIVFLLSILASWYPAYRANCIAPAKILNGQ